MSLSLHSLLLAFSITQTKQPNGADGRLVDAGRVEHVFLRQSRASCLA